MTADELFDEPPGRPAWLMTLADLALLLVGFFVFQSSHELEPRELAAAFRSGFGSRPEARSPAMPVELAVVQGFAPGSAVPGDAEAAIGWAREAARDRRTTLRITGEIDGGAADVDAATGSGPILAADRARAVAALLVRSGAVSPDRIEISTAAGRRRALLTLGYDGGRQ